MCMKIPRQKHTLVQTHNRYAYTNVWWHIQEIFELFEKKRMKKQCCDLLDTQYPFNVNRANQWIGDEERRSVPIRSFSPILSIKLQGSCHFHLYSITTTVSNLLPLHFNYFHISLRKNTIHEIHLSPSSIFFVTNDYKTWKNSYFASLLAHCIRTTGFLFKNNFSER